MNLGIERLCVFDMPPAAFARLAAELGCGFIGIGLKAMGYYNPHAYPDWSLADDPPLRRELRQVLADCGVAISLCEGFGIRPGADVRSYAHELDVVAELGGARINAASSDRDLNRTLDGFAVLTEMAAARRIETVIEIGPGPIRDLPAALQAARHVDRPEFKLLIDAMHFFRFGSRAADLAAIDRGLIGYVQLCDAPLVSRHASYMEEALYERANPGDGELPLLELLQTLPTDLVVSVEVPQRSAVEAGLGPRERVARTLQAARQLLAKLPQQA